MTTTHTYKPWTGVDFSTVRFEATQKNGKWRTEIPKPTLRFITPAMRTNWPKLGKDADIGTHFGPPPEERHKAKFQVDLTDLAIFDGSNTHEFKAFEEKLQQADDALLDFMHTRQGVLLQRTGLSKENLAMLQNRSVKPKFDEEGNPTHRSFVLRTNLMQYNSAGALAETPMPICDSHGQVINAEVHPGDAVSVLAYLRGVYVQAGKFGLQWSFEAVSIIAKAPAPPPAKEFLAFQQMPAYPFAQGLISEDVPMDDDSKQFN